jgi:hypothetical protein
MLFAVTTIYERELERPAGDVDHNDQEPEIHAHRITAAGQNHPDGLEASRS